MFSGYVLDFSRGLAGSTWQAGPRCRSRGRQPCTPWPEWAALDRISGRMVAGQPCCKAVERCPLLRRFVEAMGVREGRKAAGVAFNLNIESPSFAAHRCICHLKSRTGTLIPAAEGESGMLVVWGLAPGPAFACLRGSDPAGRVAHRLGRAATVVDWFTGDGRAAAPPRARPGRAASTECEHGCLPSPAPVCSSPDGRSSRP